MPLDRRSDNTTAAENEAAEKYFVGNAQILRRLETAQACLEKNSKIVIPEGSSPVNPIGKLTDRLVDTLRKEAHSQRPSIS